MPPLNLPISIFGRPIKPVSIGFAIFMLTFSVINVLDVGVFENSVLGDVVAVLAGGAFAMLVLAGVVNSQRIAEYGLLLSCTVLVIRGTFIALTLGVTHREVFFSIATAIIAGGSYFLERTDPRGSGVKH